MIIGIWGDSITYGGSEEGWVGMLREVLGPNNTEVYNRGICGDTSADILARFPIEREAISPDVIVFAVGVNDSKFTDNSKINKVPVEQFRINVGESIRQAQTKGARVILVGLIDINEVQIENLKEAGARASLLKTKEIEKYDDCLKDLAKERGIEFVELQGVINPQTDLEDGLHPNASGYKKMFERILPVFKK